MSGRRPTRRRRATSPRSSTRSTHPSIPDRAAMPSSSTLPTAATCDRRWPSLQPERDLVREQPALARQHDARATLLDEIIELVDRKRSRGNAVAHPQRELQAFERALVVVEHLISADGLLAALDQVEVPLGRAD